MIGNSRSSYIIGRTGFPPSAAGAILTEAMQGDTLSSKGVTTELSADRAETTSNADICTPGQTSFVTDNKPETDFPSRAASRLIYSNSGAVRLPEVRRYHFWSAKRCSETSVSEGFHSHRSLCMGFLKAENLHDNSKW